VETEEQLAFLRKHGCDEFQGFLFGRPGSAARIEELVQRWASEQADKGRIRAAGLAD
jgi:EAL domain-containing protein (putative c-di-GMP-specific phosphodiesterase class I)